MSNNDQVGLVVEGAALNISAHKYSLENITEAAHSPDIKKAGELL